ncbi:MAG: hypothetical protein ACYTEI_03165 [Planctomycetota bacterium]|jgi:hypothetical protein
MTPANDPGRIEQIRMGPIKVVEVLTSPAPSEQRVTEALGNETVPFEKIKHLISDKPLRRANPNEPGH